MDNSSDPYFFPPLQGAFIPRRLFFPVRPPEAGSRFPPILAQDSSAVRANDATAVASNFLSFAINWGLDFTCLQQLLSGV